MIPPVTVLCLPFDMFSFLECAFRGDEMIILASFSVLVSFFCDASDLTDLLLGFWLAFFLVLSSSPLCGIDYLPYSFGGIRRLSLGIFAEINLKYTESRLILNNILCQ